jgi:hypothetical protein
VGQVIKFSTTETTNYQTTNLRGKVICVAGANNWTLILVGRRDYQRLLTVCTDQWPESFPIENKLRQGRKHIGIRVTWIFFYDQFEQAVRQTFSHLACNESETNRNMHKTELEDLCIASQRLKIGSKRCVQAIKLSSNRPKNRTNEDELKKRRPQRQQRTWDLKLHKQRIKLNFLDPILSYLLYYIYVIIGPLD